MRDFKGIKRQRNRNRNGGGGGGGGGKPQNNANRAFDSTGPDGVKVRGAAQHVYEKYQQLARDAYTSGDRVVAENHLQHAEHYFRVLRAMQPQRPLSDIIGRDQFVSGYDIDFEDESGQGEGSEGESEAGENDGDRPESRQEQRPESRSDTRPEQRQESRDDRGYRDQRPRDEWRGDDRGDRNSYDRQDRRGQTNDRFRDDRPRTGDRPRFDRQDQRPADRSDRNDPRQPTPYRSDAEDQRSTTVEPEIGSGPMLRANDGDVSYAPAFLQTRTPEARDEGASETPRPRRRRAPRDLTDAAQPPEPEEV